jgi:predicted O-methyltransferase YrrM
MKKRILLFTIFFFSCCGIVHSELSPAYYNAKILPFVPIGFHVNCKQLEALIHSHNVKTIIEVGSFFGASTRQMASCLPEDGIIYAVDHFMGSVEHQPGERAWFPEVARMYDFFLSNAIRSGLAHKIVPVKMESLEAALVLQVTADLIYIDASHDTDSVYRDLVAWSTHLKEDGILCGDDWTWESVRKAVEMFAENHHLHIDSSGNFWRLLAQF